MIRIPYTEGKTRRGESFWTPRVTAQFLGERPFSMLVDLDTGADRTTFPIQANAQLGFDLDACEKQTVRYAGYDDIDYWSLPGAWYVQLAGLPPVEVRPMIGPMPRPVLGMDFLSHFSATFHGPGRYVELEHLVDIADVMRAELGPRADDNRP